jgi:hypothetical protein
VPVEEDAIRDDGQDSGRCDVARDTGQDKESLAGHYNEKLTVAQAAEVLDLSKEAVRKRISRGTLRSEKDADGTVYVYVPYTSGTPSGTEGTDRDLLYQEMRDRISYLERQVEEEREARRRADTLLARLMDRLPELESPERPLERPLEGPQTATDTNSGTEGPGYTERPQERPSEERRGFWSRLFSG